MNGVEMGVETGLKRGLKWGIEMEFKYLLNNRGNVRTKTGPRRLRHKIRPIVSLASRVSHSEDPGSVGNPRDTRSRGRLRHRPDVP